MSECTLKEMPDMTYVMKKDSQHASLLKEHASLLAGTVTWAGAGGLALAVLIAVSIRSSRKSWATHGRSALIQEEEGEEEVA